MSIKLLVFGMVVLWGCGLSPQESAHMQGPNRELLNEIVEGFDAIMIEVTGKQNLDSAYTAYANDLSFIESFEEVQADMDILRGPVLSLLDTLSTQPCFETIWTKNYGYHEKDFIKDTVSAEYETRPPSPYLDFLVDRSKSDSMFTHYADAIRSSGTIPLSWNLSFANQIDHFDLTNREDRLILAIHYITISSCRRWKTGVPCYGPEDDYISFQ